MTEETRGILHGGSPSRSVLFAPYSTVLCYLVPIAILLSFRCLLPVNICDDAYITFKVAANAADGRGMVFNPGENTYVSTSPMWVLLLASFRLLLGDVVLAAKTLGTICEILLVLSMVHLSRRTHQGARAGMFAALLLITNPVFLLTSFSGMELPLYLLVILLTALSFSQGRHALAMACGACAVWVRFDGIVVFGVAVAIFLWLERKQLRKQPLSVFVKAIPGATIMLGFVLFGTVFFETWIPMSVQRKALTSADFLSPDYLRACKILLAEFANAVLGKSAYWYRHNTAFAAMAVPFVVGVILQAVMRRRACLPLFLITIAYVGAFVGSGSEYAHNFPWYFVPILPAVYLVCGAGIAWLLPAVSRESSLLQNAERIGALSVLTVMCWLVVSIGPLYRDADYLTSKKNKREREYATAAVWAGKHLGRDALVAANEIGTIGFFLPREASMIDTFGLLSRKDMLQSSSVQRIRQKLPDCIITRTHFNLKAAIEAEMESHYYWHRFKTLEVGIRSDLMASLQPRFSDFATIHETIDMDGEYHWNH